MKLYLSPAAYLTQWLYCNFTLHHQMQGDLSTWRRVRVQEEIQEFANCPSDKIPNESQFFLEIDFTELVVVHPDQQVYWVAVMWVTIKGGKEGVGTEKQSSRGYCQ